MTRISPKRRDPFEDTGDLDIAFSHPSLPRFRVNGFRQRGATSFAFRVIPSEIPSFATLGLPPGVGRLAEEQRGLVLVTGATGSGKTTTLASMLDHINRTRRQHIVTVEDPIEILHPDRGCIVNQREVGLDTASFEQALRRVLRQDPDVILIGELRDTETAHTALQAAESGHLVFSTLHTIDAAESIGRMIEFFPPAKQQQIRSILAGTLRGIVSQRLLPRIDGGRVPAVEVMVTNARIQDLIRENRPDEITDAIAAGEFFQMQSFAQSLIDARAPRRGRPRRRRQRGDEPPRLPRRARAGREGDQAADQRSRKRRARTAPTASPSRAPGRSSPGSASPPLVPSPFRGYPSQARAPDGEPVDPVLMRRASLRLMRRAQRALAREHGFTLVEMLMAGVILLILATGIAGVLTSSIAAHTVARERTSAEQCASRPGRADPAQGLRPRSALVSGNPPGTVPPTAACGNGLARDRDGRDLLRRRPDADELRHGRELQEGHRHGHARPRRQAAGARRHVSSLPGARAVRRHQQRDHQRHR